MLVGMVLAMSGLTSAGGEAWGMVSWTSAGLEPWADGRACAFDSSIVSPWVGRYPGLRSWGVIGLPSRFAGWR